MSNIKILKDHVINKIAAGEVIERPASVVKELIENSIDSHSSKISVDIKKAGRMFIKVIDDGIGMSEDNALLCLERHATSKINNEDDIFSIITLGFRGEAIPSIAAISKMTITTRESDSIEGTQIKVEGGNVKRVVPAACPEGTAVTVRNLFFNTPVRLRYLKSDTVESSEIVETVKNLALAHPAISLSLMTNNRLIFKTPGNGKLEDAIISIFGTKIFDKLVPIQFSSIMEIEGMTPSPIKINGFLGKPEGARSSRNMSHFFINGRCVKTPLLLKAVTNAYGPALPHRKFPYIFINIKLNPELLDVNIHPAKKEIKFQNERAMFSIINSVTARNLQSEKIFQVPEQLPEKKENSTYVTETSVEKTNLSFDTMFHGGREVYVEKTGRSPLEQILPTTIEKKIIPVTQETDNDISDFLKTSKAVGQVLQTYIIAEHNGGFILIDQHAAHEKIVFEKLMKEYEAREHFESQRILFPVLIELNPTDILLLKEKEVALKSFGFEIEDFGDNTFIIKSIPLIFGNCNSKESIYELLDLVMNELSTKNLTEATHELISGFACKKAIKANDPLTKEAQQALINELSKLEDPTRCPHGRPTTLSFTNAYLRKIFHRT